MALGIKLTLEQVGVCLLCGLAFGQQSAPFGCGEIYGKKLRNGNWTNPKRLRIRRSRSHKSMYGSMEKMFVMRIQDYLS